MIDFNDKSHPVKAFRCCCGSELCRDKKTKGQLSLDIAFIVQTFVMTVDCFLVFCSTLRKCIGPLVGRKLYNLANYAFW